MLAGPIDGCGLCSDYGSERELHAIARANHAFYRDKNYKRWRLARLFARIRGLTQAKYHRRTHATDPPRIEFIGVWDTVDAYGFLVQEPAVLWDRFIFTMQFENRQLNKRDRKACHAVSIDDERHTFHPVLWNEADLRDEAEECDPERIEKVWFPGVHSDVGDGYPRNGLSLVSLDWIISKVEASAANPFGLIFLSDLREEYRRRCDWHGIQHDSRTGLRAFYRYKPRNIEGRCRVRCHCDKKVVRRASDLPRITQETSSTRSMPSSTSCTGSVKAD